MAQRIDEKQLVDKIVEGDERALYDIYNLYHKQLFNFINKRLLNTSVSEEIVQDVFIHFFESLRDFRYQCSLKTFIHTIARNKMIDYMRKKKIKKVVFSALPDFIVEGLTKIDFDEEFEKIELQQKLDRTLQELPHEYQIILRLKYIENKSVKHISSSLLKTIKSTESMLFRARKAFIKIYTLRS